MASKPSEHFAVLIGGAGPVGLLVALRLGQAGISTLVVERHHQLLPTTRAIVYRPVVLDALRSLGILDRVQKEAFPNLEGIYWRKPDGTQLAHLPVPDHSEPILLLGQSQMNALILDELQKYPSVEVRFDTEAAGFKQDDKHVTAMLHSAETSDDYFVTADFVVGADGANSRVRRSLAIPFEGFSFNDFHMVGADILYDLSKDMGSLMNFIVDPVDWATIIYTGQDRNGVPGGPDTPLWRVAFTEPVSLSQKPEDLVTCVKERIAHYAHGHSEFDIKRAEPYKLHQRCAAQSHKGRIGLAGDALHSNNPIGGLGLTTGILDAHSYGLALVRILKGGESTELFSKAADARRAAWLATTGPTALREMKRVSSTVAEDIAEREEFFEKLASREGFATQLRNEMEAMRGDRF